MPQQNPVTRLLKTKLFVEQLIIKRREDGLWEPPIAQGKSLDQAINDWIDQTGNEVVNLTAPSMYMQWMDTEKTVRVVLASVMVVFVPAIQTPTPVLQENNATVPRG